MTHRLLMLSLGVLMLHISLTSCFAAPDPGREKTTDLTIDAAGYKWHVSVQIPPQYDGTQPVPLVVILHGAGGDGRIYLERTGWLKKANKEGFIAVAPDGQPSRPHLPAEFRNNPRIWNTGQHKPEHPRRAIDDIAFLKTLLAEIEKTYKIDPHRVYLTGHSNGASMTFTAGAALADKVAAIAPVAGLCWVKELKLARPVPTLYIIGMLDKLVPVAGGESITPWETRVTPPVSESLAEWAKAIGCKVVPELVSEKNGIRIVRYPSTHSGGADLTAYYLERHGHGWPGGLSMLPEMIMGPSRTDFNATDVIWEFFARHQKR